ncbi:DUF2922 domain-containing protein [Desulfosporosinus sp. PR]|uniref:DUF2922 domain-containing protein n=1 Tax=Candidatus Desulfosporosinus nitrosoreducens TaxID=3401928 RepID=UPI0027E7BE01|nr:DUF2922 domain-containing protein [Desulfosporosinus sp. PR]MDQ7093616.1 DUF2922 domain-containing protein [Desulfosporosinus sp. PR]
MAVTSSRVLKLTFTTSGGKTFVLTIPQPKEDLDKAEAEALMDEIIQKNLFITPSGALNGKKDIRIIDTSVNDLFDPPQD